MPTIPARRSCRVRSVGSWAAVVAFALSAAWANAQTTIYNSSTTVSGADTHEGYVITDNATVTVYSAESPASLSGSGDGYIGGDAENSGTGTLNIVRQHSVSNGTGYLGHHKGSNGTATVTGTWTNSSDLFVGVNGNGTLTVTGSGSVILPGGIVNVNSGAGTITLAQNTNVSNPSGTLNIGAASGSAAAVGGVLNAATVDGGDGTGTLQFNTTGTTYFTKDGTDSGTGVNSSGSLRLINTAGTTVITGTLDHSGGTTINGGTLQIGNGGTTGWISGNITNNAALIFDRSDASTYAGNLSGTGTLTKAGAGTLSLTGASTHTGGTTISGGMLQIGKGNTSGSIAGNITNNAFLDFAVSLDVTYNGNLSGTGSLSKSGFGTLTLSGDSSHSGGTTISAGTLQIGNGGTSGSIAGNITNNAALIFDRSNALSYGGNITGTGSLTKSGAGTLTLTGTNTFSGFAKVLDGTLQISDGGTTSNGSSYIDSNGTVTITGAGSTWTNSGTFRVGDFGIGAFAVSDGGKAVSSSSSFIGANSGSSGTATITGIGSTWTNSETLFVGYDGTGSLTVSDGGKVSSSIVAVGDLGAGSVTVTGAGSALSTSGEIIVGRLRTGSLTVGDGGKVNVNSGSGTVHVGYFSNSIGTLNIGAAANDTAASAGVLNAATVQGGAGTGTLQFNTTGTTFFTKDGLSGGTGVNTGGALKLINTAGTTVVLGNLAHTGGTTINGGIIQIGNGGTTGSIGGNITNYADLVFDRSNALSYGGNITGTGNGTITVADGIVYFNGSVAGNTVTVESGAGIGGTGILGNGLDLQSGSSLNFNLTAGGHGLSITGGDFDIGSGITINFTDGGGFGNDTYDLIDGTGSNITNHDVGSFTFGYTPSGFNYSLAWSGDILQLIATGGTDPDYSAVPSAVPEPSSAAALLGLAALGFVTRRRRSSRGA